MDGIIIHLDDGWHEMKVGSVYEGEAVPSKVKDEAPTLRAKQTPYLAKRVEAAPFGKDLWVEAARRGVSQAEEVVIVGDGASWIWNVAQSQFGAYRRIEIVDWYHATQHVWPVAKTLYGENTPETSHWAQARLQELWNGDVETLLQEFDAAATFRPSAGAAVDEHRQYFSANLERLPYAKFRAAGYQIGSGNIESACKRVIAARLKQASMIGSSQGAIRIAHLRALVLSHRWDAFWKTRQPPKRHYHRKAA